MANFTINISHPPAPTYTALSTRVIQRENCGPINESLNVNIIDDASTSFSFISQYTGEPWNDLVIHSISNSNTEKFRLQLNGSTVENGTTIDITGLGDSVAIPNLLVDINNHTPDATDVIAITWSLVDENGFSGPQYVTSFQLQEIACTTLPADPGISGTTFQVADECPDDGQQYLFTITGDPNQVIRYQIYNADNGNHGYTSELENTDTTSTYGPTVAPFTGASVNGNITLDADGINNFRWSVCARPSLGDGDNVVTVHFTLYEGDNVTLNTAERLIITATSPYGF